jgi:hypothetical protein
MTENDPAYREFLKAQGFVETFQWDFEHPEYDCRVIIDGGWLLEHPTVTERRVPAVAVWITQTGRKAIAQPMNLETTGRPGE